MAGLLGVVAVGLAVVAAPASADPPPGRAYELVSPVDDPSGAVGGLSTDLNPMPGIASDDGDTLLYGAGSVLGDSWSGPANPMIFGHRTATGWQARTATRSLDEGDTPLEASASEAQSGRLLPDGRSYIFGVAGNMGAAPTAPGQVLPGIFRSPNADVVPDWLSRPTGGILPYVSNQPRGPLAISATVSRNGDVVAFSSNAPLTPDAPPLNTSAVYVVRDGELELAGRLPDGSVPTQEHFMANASDANAGAVNPPSVTHRNQLAGDGRFLLFRNATTRALYARDLENDVTHQLAGGGGGASEAAASLMSAWGGVGQTVAAENRTVPEEAFVFGARSGPRAYFKGFRASNAVAAFVYEANLETGSVTARTAITGPPLGVSPDGNRMLFLEPPAAGTTAGDWTLRYWDRSNPGTSTTVGTIATAANPAFGRARVYRSSEDGLTWTFTAIGSPDPARPNVTPTTQQLYRWTVGEITPTCLTCEPVDNTARTSGVNLTVQENIATESLVAPTTAGNTGNADLGRHKRKLSQPGHSVSDDGRWILFDSPDRLVDEDTNDVRDVYLWDRDGAPGGELQLVTGGDGNTPSYALDLDPSGRNAFFSTREGLLPEDTNGNYNVYTARIGGGFPPPPSLCVAEGCRPPVIADPPGGLVGSNVRTPVPNGPGQPVQKGTPTLRVRSIRTAATRLTVRVDTPGAGKIRVSGKAVKTTNRSAKRATTYTLRAPLSTSARRTVARGKTVRVNLRVQFTPSGSKKAQRVTSSVSVKKGR